MGGCWGMSPWDRLLRGAGVKRNGGCAPGAAGMSLGPPYRVSVPHSGTVPPSLLPQQEITESLSDSITFSTLAVSPSPAGSPHPCSSVVSPHMTVSLLS